MLAGRIAWTGLGWPGAMPLENSGVLNSLVVQVCEAPMEPWDITSKRHVGTLWPISLPSRKWLDEVRLTPSIFKEHLHQQISNCGCGI